MALCPHKHRFSRFDTHFKNAYWIVKICVYAGINPRKVIWYGRGQKLTPPVGPKIRSFIHFLLIFFASFSWRKFCFFAIYLFIFFFCPKIKFFDTYFIVESSGEKSKNATSSKSFWSNFMKISPNFWFSGQDPAEI